MAQMVIYLDEETKEAVKQAASAENRSISNMVRIWIEQGLERLILQGSSNEGKFSLQKQLANHQAVDPRQP